jgi:signal transduction histidine kinase
MSHELRTPLNAVINYAEMLEEELGAKGLEAACEDARRIRRAGRQLLGLINDVLEVAESSRADLIWEEADVRELLREAIRAVRDLAQENGNRIVAKATSEVGRVLTAPARLRDALIKLASNACKFTQNGLISIYASIEADHLVVRVRDNGVGMSPEELARIFQPFVQVDDSDTRRAGGSGLGLVITRSIARMMGGDVQVQSAPAVGSTFTLRVPVRRPAVSQVA